MHMLKGLSFAITVSALLAPQAHAGYAGNLTVASNGTCAGISGTFPASANVTVVGTSTTTYVNFIVPLPAPALPQYLVLSFQTISGKDFAYTASNPELFKTTSPLAGFWVGPITAASQTLSNQVTVNSLQFGGNLVLQANGSTTSSTPVQSAVPFNGGTCGLSYTGFLFQTN